MRSLAISLIAAAGLMAQVEPVTEGTFPAARPKINRNFDKSVTRDGASTRCVSSSNSATAYTCALSPVVTACSSDMRILWTPDVQSGATPTLDIGCGAKALKTNENAAVSTGQFAATVPVELRYDGTAWRAPSVIPGSAGGAVTGTLSVGSGVPSGDNAITVMRTVTNPLSAGGGHGFQDIGVYTPSAAGGYASFDALLTFTGTVNSSHFRGFQSRPNYNNSGTLDQLAAFFSQPTHTQGTTTNSYGFYVANPLGSGTVTNLYGLWCEDLTKGASSNYCLYSSGTAPNYLGGKLEVGGELRTNSYLLLNPIAASALPTPTNGQILYCSDCDTPASPGATCSAGGDHAGAMAMLVRNAWRCY